MIQFLEMTPWWIYILFIYFLMLGFKAANPSVASLKRLSIIPLFFLGWAIYHLSTDLEERYFFLLPWGLALAAGSYLGYLQVRGWAIGVDQERRTLILPGSWSTLLLSLSLFALKYAFGFVYATNPTAHLNASVFGADLLASGIIVGMFWGRFWHFSRVLL
jgi:hypothetical protein